MMVDDTHVILLNVEDKYSVSEADINKVTNTLIINSYNQALVPSENVIYKITVFEQVSIQ